MSLDVFFAPKTVAVIGATENAGSVGRTVLWNLVASPFGGTVFPVNPKRPSVLGMKAYKHISEVPEPVDLAVIVTPAATVPGIIRECAAQGVRGAIIISAGFKEIGPAGVELERQILAEARGGRHAHDRTELPGRDEPADGAERHLRAAPSRGPAMSASSARAARCARRFWTGACAKRSVSARFVSTRLDAGRGLGRPDLLPGRRSAHAQHRDLHGDRSAMPARFFRRRARWR